MAARGRRSEATHDRCSRARGALRHRTHGALAAPCAAQSLLALPFSHPGPAWTTPTHHLVQISRRGSQGEAAPPPLCIACGEAAPPSICCPQEGADQLQGVYYTYYREGLPFHRLNGYRFIVSKGYRFIVDKSPNSQGYAGGLPFHPPHRWTPFQRPRRWLTGVCRYRQS
jgi:hypothetical protein